MKEHDLHSYLMFLLDFPVDDRTLSVMICQVKVPFVQVCDLLFFLVRLLTSEQLLEISQLILYKDVVPLQ